MSQTITILNTITITAWPYLVAYSFPLQAASDFTTGTMSRISMSQDPTSNIGSCDLVVEAIVENMTIKQQLFKQLDEAAPS